MAGTLDELRAMLEREVVLLREQVKSWPTWIAACQRYGIQPPTPSTDGGPVPAAQLRSIVNGLVIEAARELERLGPSSPQDAVVQLWNLLGCLADEEVKLYEAGLGPPKPRSRLLGNILQNATASVGKGPFDHIKWKQKIVVLCKTCGASQQQQRNFRCAYCGGHLFHRPDEEH